MVNYDGAKNNVGGGRKGGFVSVETITPKTIINQQKQQPSTALTMEKEYHHTTKSTLTIQNATPNDAGNYTCKPSNAVEASIQVFVSEGKKFFLINTSFKWEISGIYTILKFIWNSIVNFSDRQSEPLLRPDAKDHASSIFHQIETHRSDPSSNNKESNVFSSNVVGLQDTSSASLSIHIIWFQTIQLSLLAFLSSKTIVWYEKSLFFWL